MTGAAGERLDIDATEALLRRAEHDMRLLDGRDFDEEPWAEIWRLIAAIRSVQETRLAPLVSAIYALLLDEVAAAGAAAETETGD